jgi:hypothetical protein
LPEIFVWIVFGDGADFEAATMGELVIESTLT